MKDVSERLQYREQGWPTVISLLTIDLTVPLLDHLGLQPCPTSWGAVQLASRSAHARIRPDADAYFLLSDETTVEEVVDRWRDEVRALDDELLKRAARLAGLTCRYLGPEHLVVSAWRQTFSELCGEVDKDGHSVLADVLGSACLHDVVALERRLRALESSLTSLLNDASRSFWDEGVFAAFRVAMGSEISPLESFLECAEISDLQATMAMLRSQNAEALNRLHDLHKELRAAVFPARVLDRLVD